MKGEVNATTKLRDIIGLKISDAEFDAKTKAKVKYVCPLCKAGMPKNRFYCHICGFSYPISKFYNK